MPTVKYDDLENAMDFVTGGDALDAAAYISRQTGTIDWHGIDMEPGEALSEDIGDTALDAEVFSRRELGLGTELVFRYVSEMAPEAYEAVSAMFRRKGAYARFKDWLGQRGSSNSGTRSSRGRPGRP